MRQISLREFRTRGAKALEKVPRGETVLLSGQNGPAYFLVPAIGDLAQMDEDLRTQIALADLRENQQWAKSMGYDKLTMDEVDEIIREVRREMKSETA